MTSNPKPIVTIVKPEDKGALVQRSTRVFVGDVELPVKSVYVDLYNGDVDLTLHPEEVRIVREAPAPAAPEPAEPEEDVHIFKADPRSVVVDSEFTAPPNPWGTSRPRAKHTLTFAGPVPGAEAATVTVSVPRPKPAGSGDSDEEGEEA